MSDLSKWSVRGPVHTLRIDLAEWDLTREEWQAARGHAHITFHPDGRIGQTEHHNPDGSRSRTEYSYDEAGRLIEMQFRSDKGTASKLAHFYDPDGRPVRTVRVDSDGVEQEIEVYGYDERGRKTKFCFLSSTPNRATSYGIEGTELAYGAPGAATMTVRYGESGMPDEVLFHDAERKPVRRVTFERDERGRLLRERLLSGEESPFPDLEQRLEAEPPEKRDRIANVLSDLFGPNRTISETTYRYDQNGRILERYSRMGTLGGNRDRFRYDEHGNTIEHMTEHESREFGIDEQGNPHTVAERSSRQHARFEYRCDAHGNWTERVVWSRPEPNPNFERSNIERRTITYYSD